MCVCTRMAVLYVCVCVLRWPYCMCVCTTMAVLYLECMRPKGSKEI